MTQPPVRARGGRLWRCDGCGKTSRWTKRHMIYGSLRDEDEQRWERMQVTCSDKCRVRVSEASERMIPLP